MIRWLSLVVFCYLVQGYWEVGRFPSSFKEVFVLLAVLSVSLMFFLIAYAKKPACESCGSRLLKHSLGRVVNEYYTHTNKDGSPDRRHKSNPIIQEVERISTCNACEHQSVKIITR